MPNSPTVLLSQDSQNKRHPSVGHVMQYANQKNFPGLPCLYAAGNCCISLFVPRLELKTGVVFELGEVLQVAKVGRYPRPCQDCRDSL